VIRECRLCASADEIRDLTAHLVKRCSFFVKTAKGGVYIADSQKRFLSEPQRVVERLLVLGASVRCRRLEGLRLQAEAQRAIGCFRHTRLFALVLALDVCEIGIP
jgi:hypothetical protein